MYDLVSSDSDHFICKNIAPSMTKILLLNEEDMAPLKIFYHH